MGFHFLLQGIFLAQGLNPCLLCLLYCRQILYHWATRETQQGILLSHWKEWSNAICSNIDGPGEYHTKWNKSDRKTNILWYHLYVESKKWYNWTYLQNRNRLTELENELMVTMGSTEERNRMGVWDWHVHTVIFKTDNQGISLVVQWQSLLTPNARGPGSTPSPGTRSLMLQLRVCISQ